MNEDEIYMERNASLSDRLEKIIRENENLIQIRNEKLEKLKLIRIKELRITLRIYQLEELYLIKIKNKLVHK